MPLWVVIRAPPSPADPLVAARGCSSRARASAAGIHRGGDQVDVVTGLGLRRAEPATSTASLAGWARRSAARRSATGSTSERRSRSAGPLSANSVECLENVLLELRAKALEPADPLILGRGSELLEARHPELVVEAPRRLRPNAGNPRDLDQGRRKPALELRRRRDLTFVEKREHLLLERPAHPGQLGDRPSRASSSTDTGLWRTLGPPLDRRAPGTGSPRRARKALPAR